MRKFLFAAAIFVASIGCTNNQPAQTECCKECKNPVIENIMARRSVRAYKEQAVPRELLEQVVECGINAPQRNERPAVGGARCGVKGVD